jgi:hypothetical protein
LFYAFLVFKELRLIGKYYSLLFALFICNFCTGMLLLFSSRLQILLNEVSSEREGHEERIKEKMHTYNFISTRISSLLGAFKS